MVSVQCCSQPNHPLPSLCKREGSSPRSVTGSPAVQRDQSSDEFKISTPSAFSKLNLNRSFSPLVPSHGSWSSRYECCVSIIHQHCFITTTVIFRLTNISSFNKKEWIPLPVQPLLSSAHDRSQRFLWGSGRAFLRGGGASGRQPWLQDVPQRSAADTAWRLLPSWTGKAYT